MADSEQSNYLTSTEMLEAQRVLAEELAREGYGPPLIGDNVLRTCLASVNYALANDSVETRS